MAKLTKGTQVYFIDPADGSVTEIPGVVSLNPGGTPADQIETTTLTDEAKTFLRGMRTPGQASMEINVDPSNTVHARLHELSQDDDVDYLPFAVGFSDGTVDPTADDSDDFDQDAVARSFYYFDGYIADFPLDFAINSVVKTTVQIQRTGQGVLVPTT